MKVEKILTPAPFVAGILYKLFTFKVVTPPDMAALVAVSMDYCGGGWWVPQNSPTQIV